VGDDLGLLPDALVLDHDHPPLDRTDPHELHLGEDLEVMVEGKNQTRGQWIGRTTQNKTLNFIADRDLELGSYVPVHVTTAFPNSLVGELTGSNVGLSQDRVV